MLKWIAIVADVTAVFTVVTGSKAIVIGVFGALAALVGLIQFGRLANGLPKVRTAIALVSIIAGTATLTVVIDRDLVGTSTASGDGGVRSPSSTMEDITGSTSTTLPSGVPKNATSSAGPAETSVTRSDAAKAVPLSSLPIVGRSDSYYESGPLKINGTTRQKVMTAEPYNCEKYVETYQVDRKYNLLKVEVGLGDETQSDGRVTFSIGADESIRASSTIGIGQVQELEADVSGAFRVYLVMDPSNCHSTLQAGWIDPVLTSSS